MIPEHHTAVLQGEAPSHKDGALLLERQPQRDGIDIRLVAGFFSA